MTFKVKNMKKAVLIASILISTAIVSGGLGLQYIEKQKEEQAELVRQIELENAQNHLLEYYAKNCNSKATNFPYLAKTHLRCSQNPQIPYYENLKYEVTAFFAAKKSSESDLSGLRGITKATIMDLRNANISNVDFLSNLEEVSILILRNTSISSLDGLTALTQLNNLTAVNTKLENVNGLLKLKKAYSFDLRKNPLLDDVSGLQNMVYIEDDLFLDDREFRVKIPENSAFCLSDIQVRGPKSKNQYCEGEWE
tara:strand:+ start:9127 stop:9885 length:759 start_codon:yes stop_codon:yes gene_type:complete